MRREIDEDTIKRAEAAEKSRDFNEMMRIIKENLLPDSVINMNVHPDEDGSMIVLAAMPAPVANLVAALAERNSATPSEFLCSVINLALDSGLALIAQERDTAPKA